MVVTCTGASGPNVTVALTSLGAMDRYPADVLSAAHQRSLRPTSRDVQLQVGMVVEEPTSGFVGAVTRWENGIVLLEDRKGKVRGFPIGPGFWVEGKPVALRVPLRSRTGAPAATHTASGSRIGPDEAPKVALPSRIYVEGRHDAELVEKVWGDDLRHVGVVVEYMGGIDDLPQLVTDFDPAPGRRLGVLVDHLVPGSKESRIAKQVMQSGYGEVVLICGHDYIDIWNAVRPEVIGLKAWPQVPRDVDFKKGTMAALGRPHQDQADVARFWQALLAKVRSYKDLDRRLVTEVETLIDFVTADHDLDHD